MKKLILFFLFAIIVTTGIALPCHAQIEVNSNGNVGINTSPNSIHALRTQMGGSMGSTYIANWAYVTGVGYAGIGVRGESNGMGYANYGIYGKASGGTYNWAGYFQGNVYTTGSYQSSDERLKTNIRPLDTESILAKIFQLEPLRYEFRSDEELYNSNLPSMHAKPGDHFGLIAQNLEKVFPELVIEVGHVLDEGSSEIEGDPETVTTKAINYQELTVLLLAAVQELQTEVEALKAQINEER